MHRSVMSRYWEPLIPATRGLWLFNVILSLNAQIDSPFREWCCSRSASENDVTIGDSPEPLSDGCSALWSVVFLFTAFWA